MPPLTVLPAWRGLDKTDLFVYEPFRPRGVVVPLDLGQDRPRPLAAFAAYSVHYPR